MLLPSFTTAGASGARALASRLRGAPPSDKGSVETNYYFMIGITCGGRSMQFHQESPNQPFAQGFHRRLSPINVIFLQQRPAQPSAETLDNNGHSSTAHTCTSSAVSRSLQRPST
jgi:hypothetical protein